MTPIDTAISIIAICAFGSLIIEARTHRLVSKSMHRHALAVMSDKTNCSEQNNSGYDNRTNDNNGHGAPRS